MSNRKNVSPILKNEDQTLKAVEVDACSQVVEKKTFFLLNNDDNWLECCK